MGIVIDGVRMGGSIADVTMRTGAVANRCVMGTTSYSKQNQLSKVRVNHCRCGKT